VNKIVNWAARLGEPSVNFDLSRAKKLKIRSHVTDSSLWSLAEQASKTLEELTIDRLPCGWLSVPSDLHTYDIFLDDETFPPPDRFAQYRALRSLSLTLVHEPEERFPIHKLCRSLALIFTHPLPSTLHRISINLDLECCSDTDWEYTFPRFLTTKTLTSNAGTSWTGSWLDSFPSGLSLSVLFGEIDAPRLEAWCHQLLLSYLARRP
jgi:hypothetical protein